MSARVYAITEEMSKRAQDPRCPRPLALLLVAWVNAINSAISEGDNAPAFQAGSTLREKLEGPSAMREIVAAARAITERPFGTLRQRDFYRLREALAQFDDIRTGL